MKWKRSFHTWNSLISSRYFRSLIRMNACRATGKLRSSRAAWAKHSQSPSVTPKHATLYASLQWKLIWEWVTEKKKRKNTNINFTNALAKWKKQSVSCISSIHNSESHISYVSSFILPKTYMCNCVGQDIYFSSQISEPHKAITCIWRLILNKHFYNRNGPKAEENSTLYIYIVATSSWFRNLKR